MNTRTVIFHAWFDHVTREFRTLAAAKQWIADHLGGDNTTDDYGVQHLDPREYTVVTDVLGADAIPRLKPPRLPGRDAGRDTGREAMDTTVLPRTEEWVAEDACGALPGVRHTPGAEGQGACACQRHDHAMPG